jgi:hypothetical protein
MASPSHRSLRAFKTGCADEYASTKTPCAISDLETQLRARLFNRTTRRIVLTGVGERYLRRCKQALAYVDEAQGRTRASRRKAQGLFDGQLGSAMLSKQSGGIRSGIPTFASKLPSRNGCLTCLRMATISRSSLHAKFPIPPLCHTVLEAHSTSSAAPPAYLADRGVPGSISDLANHNCLQLVSPIFPADKWVFEGPDGEETVDLP